MNFIQLGLFIIFALASLVSGLGLFALLKGEDRLTKNRFLFLGESLLLGASLIVGELLLLSILSLYQQPYLWGVVLLNFLFLASPNVRGRLQSLFRPPF